MKTLKLTFLLSSLCFALSLNAQSSLPKATADSLWNVWQDEKQPDTLRLQAIHKYALNGYFFNQPDSAFYFAGFQYDFAQTKGLKKYMANAAHIQGASFYIRGDYAVVLSKPNKRERYSKSI